MSLINIFQDAGDGIVTSQRKNIRIYRVGEENDYVDYLETEEFESRVWVGLTKQCALNHILLAPQPSGSFESYSWSAEEDSRVIESYKVRRDFSKKITEVYAQTAAPPSTAPSISTGSNNISDVTHFENTYPSTDLGTITIQSNMPPSYSSSTKIYYRQDYINLPTSPSVNNGDIWPHSRYYYPENTITPTDFIESESNSVNLTLTVPRTTSHATRLSNSTTAGSGLRLAFIIKVRAYTVTYLQTQAYASLMNTKYIHCKSNVWS